LLLLCQRHKMIDNPLTCSCQVQSSTWQISCFILERSKLDVWLSKSCIFTDIVYGFPQTLRADPVTLGLLQASLWPLLFLPFPVH
jgi:hypothetical protein